METAAEGEGKDEIITCVSDTPAPLPVILPLKTPVT
jgi:hypothetical protein